MPPREYDERRDEAILESILPAGETQSDLARAAAAVRSAFEFTLPNDSAWSRERELLTLLRADLKERSQGPAAAEELLEATESFASHLYFTRRSQLYRRLENTAAADAATRRSSEFPPDPIRESLLKAIDRLQAHAPADALTEVNHIIDREPAHFAARLLQGVCFLQLQRAAEARVAFTACIAQRPTFPWSYYFRSQADSALGNAADVDLATAATLKPSATLRLLLDRAEAGEVGR